MGDSTRTSELFASVVGASCQTVTLDDVARDVLPPLARLTDATETILEIRADDGTLEPIGGSLAWFLPTFVEHYEPDDLVIDSTNRINRPVMRISRFVDWAQFRSMEHFEEVYVPFGIAHGMACRLSDAPYGEPGGCAIVLFRSPDQPDFDDHDEQAMAALLPVLRGAARRAQLLAPLLRTPPVVEGILEAADPRPWIAVDRDGRLLWHSRYIRDVLSGGDAVPAVIAGCALRLRDLTDDGTPRRPLPPTVTIREPDARPVRAELRVARTADGAPFLVAQLQDFTRPGPAVTAAAERAGLTPAETVVLGALNLGLTNREIGHHLIVSIETVRTHVRSILRKLDVPSRRDAIARLRATTPDPPE